MSGLGKLKGLCDRCKKRHQCKGLCEKAERYVGQDYCGQKEVPISSLSDLSGIDPLAGHDEIMELLLYKNVLAIQDLETCPVPDKLHFDCLSALDNELLLLRHFERLKWKDIARRVRQNAKVCTQRYYRAIEKLKDVYSKSNKKAVNSNE